MSSRGEIAPELAELLQGIANRLEKGEAEAKDADILRRIARSAADEDAGFALKVHRKRRGRLPYKALSVDRALYLARQVQACMEKEGSNVGEACATVPGMKGVTVGADSVADAWQQMSPFLDLSGQSLETMLVFLRLKAKGAKVEIKRVERPK
jgi:hypothetical protein